MGQSNLIAGNGILAISIAFLGRPSRWVQEMNRANLSVTSYSFKLSYDRAGRWWNGNEEIDLVAVRGDEPVFAAECK